MAISATKFWDDIAQRYSKQAIGDVETYEKKLAATQALMKPEMNVLELGCGTGSTALRHAPYVAEVVATDLAPNMVAIGKAKAKEAGINNIRFMVSSVEGFEGADASFDMILALNLLHLVADRKAALANIHRLLKPGGIFISSTVCLSDKMWFLRPIIPVMQWLGKAPYVCFLSEATMRAEINSAGFEERDSWSHGLGNSMFFIAEKIRVKEV